MLLHYLLVHTFSGLGKKCTIMSTDKDFLQLVDEDVTVYSPTKRTVYTPEKVLHEYGIHPSNFFYIEQ